nr:MULTISPECIES: putative colanic acid biosynthesis acetyltransferase [unclassified Gordonia (in: high G+C Gram-positive bacteria)]
MTNLRQQNLAGFTGLGYDKGRNKALQAAWLAVSYAIFQSWWCPNAARVAILRTFGARVGRGAVIRQRVRVHWPWKLEIGDHCWLGEGVWLLNLEQITIGSNTCLSQEALICTGSHDHRSPTFEYDNGAITIGDEVWIAARATVLRGLSIGDRAVIGCGNIVTKDVAAGTIVRVNDRNYIN